MTSRAFLTLEILCMILAIVSLFRGRIEWAILMLGAAAICNSMIKRMP